MRRLALTRSLVPAVAGLLAALAVLAALAARGARGADPPAQPWTLGDPVVHYWAGPGYPGGAPLNDAAALQLKEGGWNLAWCHAGELDVAARHHLRGLLYDPLIQPASLDDPDKRRALEALVAKVKAHPGLYAYHFIDEPSAKLFPELARLAAFMVERDPAHPFYINLFPTYASNEQLGTPGGKEAAYTEHLRQFIASVHPALLSYDHYQFTNGGDSPDYFLNLELVRRESVKHGIPFMNIVQASNWVPNSAASPSAPRVPGPDEMRYLVHTTVAYGAQGISYYVYCYPQHEGGMARPDGTTTPLYDALKTLNREFVAMARELQPLKSCGAFHCGMLPPGTAPLPPDCPFQLAAPEPRAEYKPGERVRGVLVGAFGAEAAVAAATHAVVVNLDYKAPRTITVSGAGELEYLDAASGKWIAGARQVALDLKGGEGRLVRLRR